jgi:hypothetical protein
MDRLEPEKGGSSEMPQPESQKQFSFDRPGTYRILVQGSLDESWSGSLGGMNITTNDRGDPGQLTTLVGWLSDQASLAGVLHTLYDLHLTLLSVELLHGVEHH